MSGTSPNESLHAGINAWFKNQPELYSTTLTLQLEMAHLSKLLTHNMSLYRPQLRQLDQATMLKYTSRHVDLTPEKWKVPPIGGPVCESSDGI